MTKQVQRRRGTATQHTSFTGAEGELSVNTTNKSVHVHDGSTAGGIEAARADLANVSDANLNAALSGNTLSSLTITTADINGGTIDGTTIGGTTPAAITGTTITGTSFVTSGDMTFGDNDKAIFGAGSDLQIYHDGSNSRIQEQGTGNLIIRADDFRVQSVAGESYIEADANGAVSLRYDNAAKLATTSTGVDVTGTVTADGLTVDGTINGDALELDGAPSAFGSTTTTAYILKTGSTGSAPFNQAGALVYQPRVSTTEGRSNHLFYTGDPLALRMNIHPNGDLSLYEDTGTTPKFFWDASTERLGIGNAAPATALDVTGTVTADGLTVDGAYPEFILNDTRNINTWADGDVVGQITFTTDDTGMTNPIAAIKAVHNRAGTGHSSNDAGLEFYTSATTTGAISKRMEIESTTGDIHFYEDTGTTPKLTWDSSAEALGIGTSSPARQLHLISAANDGVRIDSPQPRVEFGETDTTDENFAIRLSGGDLIFEQRDDTFISTTEFMRIDSSGNVLVGKTTADTATVGAAVFNYGMGAFTRSASHALDLNRTTSDGAIINLRKDNTTVGSIGVISAANFFIGSGASGVTFRSGVPDIVPSENGANRDGTTNLGSSSARFKDLYLSGGVYLGGTGAANLLDDYEEGSFTPVVADASSGGNEATALRAYGYYTKIGRWVNIVIELTNVDTTGLTGANDLSITGLPFASASVTGSVLCQGVVQVASVDLSDTLPYITPTIPENATHMFIREWGDNTGTDSLTVSQLTSGAADINITMGYQT